MLLVVIFYSISIAFGVHGQLSVDNAKLAILMDTTNGQAIGDLGGLVKSQLADVPIVNGNNNGTISPVGYSGVRMPDTDKHIGLWSPTYSTNDSFLIAFYFKINGASEGQFFSLLDSQTSPASLSVGFVDGSKLTVYENSINIAIIQDLIDGQNWNFIAVRWLKQRQMLEIFFNSEGNTVRLMAVVPVDFTSLSNVEVAVGGGKVNSSHFMNMGMATEMACFFMFDDGVNGSKCEIAQLPEYCQSQTPVEQCNDPISSPWPKPTFLNGFWPLNSVFLNAEQSLSRLSYTNDVIAFVENGYFGPFGILKTSLTATNNLFISKTLNTFNNVKWTISFYFCSQGLGTSGLLHYYPLFVYINAESELVVRAIDMYNQNHFMNFPITNQWYFLTITYDRLTTKMDAFLLNVGERQSMTIDFWEYVNANYLFAGHSYDGSQSFPIRQGDHMACLFIYGDVLSTDEINQLPYTCRTSGFGSVPQIAEDTEFCSLDFLPLKFNATEIVSISNNNSTILLSESDSPNTPISHFQLANVGSFQNGNWRMEFDISGFNTAIRGGNFNLGIIISNQQDMERYRNGFIIGGWSQSTNDVFALLIRRNTEMIAVSPSFTSTTGCRFDNAYFSKGIKVIVQVIDGLVAIVVGNAYDGYNLKLCNSPLYFTYNFETPSIQIVAIMDNTFATSVPTNVVNSLNLDLSQFNMKLDSMKVYSIDTSSTILDEIVDANTQMLPVPTWTNLSPNRIQNLNFEISQGQENNWQLTNVTATDEGLQFGSSNSLQAVKSIHVGLIVNHLQLVNFYSL